MVAFFNSFFNYIVLLVVFALAGGIGVVLGVMARRKKDASQTEKKSMENTLN